jgi:predicted O-methyltransferase YrrM
MFTDIPQKIIDRMRFLEEKNRQGGIESAKGLIGLYQVPPETGRFIAILAASAPEGQYIEIGTSGGYSMMWLSLACRTVNRRIKTFEILDEKAVLAKETFKQAGIEDIVDFVHGDALEYLADCRDVSFCFLDAAKDIYEKCYEIVVPNMVPGGLLIADNAISHENELKPMLAHSLNDPRVDAVIVPVGTGKLVCRKV